VEIADDAHKHGVGDLDIEHAVRNAIRVLNQGDRDLYIGADRTGRLLEVVVLDDEGQPVAIHAMTLRPKFYEHLLRRSPCPVPARNSSRLPQTQSGGSTHSTLPPSPCPMPTPVVCAVSAPPSAQPRRPKLSWPMPLPTPVSTATRGLR